MVSSSRENLTRDKITRRRTLLDYAILGLIHRAPHSGYDIRKIFASSLLRLFSDSPGTVYPALRRLERDGLIEAERGAQRASHGDRVGGRGCRAFRLTPKGRKALRRWVSTPIAAEELRKNPDAFGLQFAYMSDLVDHEVMSEMLRDYARAFRTLENEVRGYQDANKDELTATGYLVLNLGSGLCRARIRWARQTIDALQRGSTKEST